MPHILQIAYAWESYYLLDIQSESSKNSIGLYNIPEYRNFVIKCIANEWFDDPFERCSLTTKVCIKMVTMYNFPQQD